MTPTQYNQLCQLLAEYSQLNAAFEAAEAEIKTIQVEAAKELLPKHAELKILVTDLEAKLRAIADANYAELFPGDPGEEKRSHATPFGALKYTKSASLEFDDVEKVLLKIKVRCVEELARESAGHPARFTEEMLIRTHEEPNLLAMETFDDATLALFGIRRVHKDNFSVKPFDMKSDKPAKVKKLKEAA